MSWKACLRRTINSALEPAGFCLRRFQPEMQIRGMESPTIRQRQIRAFHEAIVHACADHPKIAENIPDEKEIEAFSEALLACPIRQDTGGGGFSAAMLLWAISKALRPELVVESGVFRGFTTWVFRHACPHARQYAFDISFAERQRVEEGVVYHETDWMNVSIQTEKVAPALIYFDDHVDQWRRIREASQRGFRYLIFDDSLPSKALHNDGCTAAPTVDMLFESDLDDGQEIVWRTECGKFRFRYNARTAKETRELVASHMRLPDLRLIFGYSPANLIFVELR